MSFLQSLSLKSVRVPKALLVTTFWFGAVWLMLGSMVSFVPGSEVGWFALAGILLAAGLFIPRWPYRIVAASLIVVCVLAMLTGHNQGMKYRQFQPQHNGLPTGR